METSKFISCFVFLSLFQLLISPGIALPLSTNSRWIVDENGLRVKLACANWGAHLQPMTAEGLDKQPLEFITNKIASMGFNCVRFTWPTYLVTNDTLSNVTVRQSFERLGDKMNGSIVGIAALNPSLIDLPLIEAFKAVLASLQKSNVMIILDNHITVPGWCCSLHDGNGFFGDKFFDPNVWVQGLTKMATLSKNFSNVVGMSLRNELRGDRQDVSVWFREMQRGAEAIHEVNPNLLVIFSGFNFDKTLKFLHDRWLNLSFTGKLVFEVHHYGFTDGQKWTTNNPNQMCAKTINEMKWDTLFLLDKGYPLFMSEFGAVQSGSNVNDNRFMNCYIGLLAELDIDWALWTLYGSYSLRQGVVGMEESYGLLTYNWGDVRNSTFLQRLQAIQAPFRGPGLSNNTYKVIVHPLTGLCVKSLEKASLALRPCNETDGWTYTNQRNIVSVKQNFKCLRAIAEGKSAILDRHCNKEGSTWDKISASKMHLSTNNNIPSRNSTLCLDVDSKNKIVTSACKCLGNDNSCDPASQWFKLVDSGRVLN
ncbi:hypothetical protein ACFE04_003682 [Oxalis oulophora]